MTGPGPYSAQLARTPVRSSDVVVGGARAVLWHYGPSDGSPQVVVLHGLRGDHHGLEPIVAHLPGYRVTVPDLPGFGASEPLSAGRHDVDGYAAWVRELVSVVAPGGDVVVAGHSFGSVVAAAALAGGLAARALVLINPIAVAPLRGSAQGATRVTVLYHRLAAALPEWAGTALLRSRAGTRIASVAMARTRDPALRRWIHAEHGRYFNGFTDRRVLLEAFEASVTQEVARYAPAVAVPVLLVAGELDDLAPVAPQRGLVGRFPDARLVVVGGTGHLAHYEAPSAVARAVDDFLTDIEGSGR